MYQKATRLVLLNSLLSLSFGLIAEEPQRPKDTIDVNTDEEVANRIFDEWKEGQSGGMHTFPALMGFIKKAEEKELVTLITLVTYDDDDVLFPEEKEAFIAFLVKKIKDARKAGKVRGESIFVDRRTRCEIQDHIRSVECTSVFKKQEFEKKMRKNSSSWWSWNR